MNKNLSVEQSRLASGETGGMILLPYVEWDRIRVRGLAPGIIPVIPGTNLETKLRKLPGDPKYRKTMGN